MVEFREDGDRSEIIGDQADAARLLSAAWAETKCQALHDQAPTAAEVFGLLARLGGPFRN